MTAAPNQTAEPSTGELISRLTAQTSRLVRDEMRLAQKEFQESVKHAGIGAGLLSVAGLLAVLGLGALVAAAIGALALVLPVWAAGLIVAVVLFAAAGVAALVSKKQVQQVAPPAAESVESVKADIAEIKDVRNGRN